MAVRRWSFDTETFLITRDNNSPCPVCCQWYSPDDEACFFSHPGDDSTRSLLAAPEHHFVGQNIAYDIVLMMRWEPWCIPYWIRALDEGRVHDTMIREQLLHLEQHGDIGFPYRCSLEMLAKKYLDMDLSADKRGEDSWRLRYGTLYGVPFEEWPTEAIRYGLDDAVHTWQVFDRQGGIERSLPTESLQVYAAVALQAASAWGLLVNQDKVQEHRTHLISEMERLDREISETTKVWVEEHLGEPGDTFRLTGTGSSKNMQRVISHAWRILHSQIILGLAQQYSIGCDLSVLWALPMEQSWKDVIVDWAENPHHMPQWCWDHVTYNPPGFLKDLIDTLPDTPRTKKGFSTAESQLEPLFEIVPFLKQRVDYKHAEKMLATYVKPYENKRALHPRYTAVVTTGRVSCDSPNLQNVPHDFRDVVQPRPGYVFGVVDYSAIEMTTLAATIKARYGESAMGDAISNGVDLHSMTAAAFMDIDYEEFLAHKKEEPYATKRQGSKAFNFGVPGGLGKVAFSVYAKSNYGYEITPEQAGRDIRKWKNTIWPEVGVYLQDNGFQVDAQDGRRATAVNNSGRQKANCIFTQYCNYPFQSLAADGTKAAMRRIWREIMLAWYATVGNPSWEGYGSEFRGSPLAYSHLVNMVHDEIMCEHHESTAREAYALQSRYMVEEMSKFTEGITVRVEGELSNRWAH